MEKREGAKGRRPEFCASCSKAMMSYITTVRDFLDKVVEDIDMNTPSSRREEGVLARTRIATEASARDSSHGKRQISQSSAQAHQISTQPTANPPSTKATSRDEKYKSSAKFTLENEETPTERYQSHLANDQTVRKEAANHDAQSTEITSSTQKLQDTHPSNLSQEQLPERSTKFPPSMSRTADQPSSRPQPTSSAIDDTSDYSVTSPPIEHSANKQPFDLPPNNESIDSCIPINPHLDDSPQRVSGSNEITSPVQELQSKAVIIEREHPPPLYSDHLAPPVQAEQTPLPVDEPSLPDGPFPATWVEDMIRVCDIPLLLPPDEQREAYVTMATNNLTAVGCLVLGNSLRLSGTNRTLAVLVTEDVTEELRNLLASVFHLVQPISSLEPTGSTKLALLEQPELGINYSKLLVWRLNQFDKCVYLSPDTLVILNCDELFQRHELSAVPDIGWPDFFNAGVFVYVPSDVTFWDLVSFAENKGSFDGGDQGLLNFYFRSWTLDINKRLPFIYNLMANVSYTYGPAFVKFGGNAKIVHFFGTTKPWNVQFNVRTGQLAPFSGVHPTFSRYVQYWLTIFAQCVLPLFSPDIQQHTTVHGYVNAVDLARIVTGQTESAIAFSPPSFRRYLDVPESVAFPAEKVQSTLLRRLSIDEGEASEEEEEEREEEDKEAEALADLNRMQAWEQGRIDYMGEDSSDKIMKRLDRFIKKGNRL